MLVASMDGGEDAGSPPGEGSPPSGIQDDLMKRVMEAVQGEVAAGAVVKIEEGREKAEAEKAKTRKEVEEADAAAAAGAAPAREEDEETRRRKEELVARFGFEEEEGGEAAAAPAAAAAAPLEGGTPERKGKGKGKAAARPKHETMTSKVDERKITKANLEDKKAKKEERRKRAQKGERKA